MVDALDSTLSLIFTNEAYSDMSDPFKMKVWITCRHNRSTGSCSERSFSVSDIHLKDIAPIIERELHEWITDEAQKRNIVAQVLETTERHKSSSRFEQVVRSVDEQITLYVQFQPVPIVTLLAY